MPSSCEKLWLYPPILVAASNHTGIKKNYQLLAMHGEEYKYLLHRYEYFTEKQTTRIFHTELHPGYERDIFHILTSEDMADAIPLFFVHFFFIFETLIS